VPASRPAALTVAGSDNSGGAGIQADLQVFAAMGCYGQTAVTCVVAENPRRVAAVHPIPPELVAEQIRVGAETFRPRAAKTGMLYSAEIISAVSEALANMRCPVVVDPVMVASSGDPLMQEDAIEAYRKKLFPRAALLTPNADELAMLTGQPVRSFVELRDAAHALARQTGRPVLAKGGHLKGRTARDLLVVRGRETLFEAPCLRGASAHGTGCTYSAAITAGLAHGNPLPACIATAKKFITASLASGLRIGRTRVLDIPAGSRSLY
jgi:hydroxymethylpyrimidine kinase/phosphomethylpyrimidine kinase